MKYAPFVIVIFVIWSFLGCLPRYTEIVSNYDSGAPKEVHHFKNGVIHKLEKYNKMGQLVYHVTGIEEYSIDTVRIIDPTTYETSIRVVTTTRNTGKVLSADYETGQLEYVKRYKQGELHGKSVYFKNGQKFRIERYDEGELIKD